MRRFTRTAGRLLAPCRQDKRCKAGPAVQTGSSLQARHSDGFAYAAAR